MFIILNELVNYLNVTLLAEINVRLTKMNRKFISATKEILIVSVISGFDLQTLATLLPPLNVSGINTFLHWDEEEKIHHPSDLLRQEIIHLGSRIVDSCGELIFIVIISSFPLMFLVPVANTKFRQEEHGGNTQK